MGNATVRRAGRSFLPSKPVHAEPDASTRRFLLGGAALAASLVLPCARASVTLPIAVLFPDLGEPFRKVFLEMVAGIDAALPHRVKAWPVGPHSSLADLSTALKRQGARVVVALGRQGLKAVAMLDLALGVVVGGVSSVPAGERQVGVCLTPDPALLFAQLKALLPAVGRIVVVYDPQHNDWLMRGAHEAAHGLGLDLVPHEARDLASAARLYHATLAAGDGKREALWLPSDPTTVDETTIMPLVLRDSWNHRMPVFSSSLAHVNKGVLFSLYPNNVALGRSLGQLASALLAGETPARGVTPLRDVHAALNLRTASHFGISIDARMQRAFNYLYPPG